MDHINYIPSSDHYTIDNESEEQTKDVYGNIEKITDFDSVTETPKVGSTLNQKKSNSSQFPF